MRQASRLTGQVTLLLRQEHGSQACRVESVAGEGRAGGHRGRSLGRKLLEAAGAGLVSGVVPAQPQGRPAPLGEGCSRLLHWLKPCRAGQKSQAAPTVLTRRRFRRIFRVDFLLPRGWRHRPCAVRLVKTSSRVPSAPALVLLTVNMRNGFTHLLSCGFPKRGAARGISLPGAVRKQLLRQIGFKCTPRPLSSAPGICDHVSDSHKARHKQLRRMKTVLQREHFKGMQCS